MQTVAKLVNHLKQEIEWVQSLNILLSQERDFLIASEYHALEAVSSEKTCLSEQLEQSAKARMQLINPENQDADPKQSLQHFLTHCKKEEADAIQAQHKILAEKLMICQELNSINGQVIATNIYRREELLTIITGKESESLNVYTSVGSMAASTSTNHYKEV